MAFKLTELPKKELPISPGHRVCAGCPEPMIIKQAILASKEPVVVGEATGCFEVSSCIFPYTSWNVNWYHNAFENAAAIVSGMEAAYKALSKRGKVTEPINFIAFGGDGGTYDIGFQALSGAMERGHRMLYICMDNQAYMNTGIQRSGATPLGAWTTTCHVGKVRPGNVRASLRKDIVAIMAAHDIAYAAQASLSHWNDFMRKVEKALSYDGPSFITVLAPCPRGWRFPASETVNIAKLAVETGFWPLYEVDNGQWNVTFKPRTLKPLEDFLKTQGRYAHLFKSDEGKEVIEHIKELVQYKLNYINHMAEATKGCEMNIFGRCALPDVD